MRVKFGKETKYQNNKPSLQHPTILYDRYVEIYDPDGYVMGRIERYYRDNTWVFSHQTAKILGQQIDPDKLSSAKKHAKSLFIRFEKNPLFKEHAQLRNNAITAREVLGALN